MGEQVRWDGRTYDLDALSSSELLALQGRIDDEEEKLEAQRNRLKERRSALLGDVDEAIAILTDSPHAKLPEVEAELADVTSKLAAANVIRGKVADHYAAKSEAERAAKIEAAKAPYREAVREALMAAVAFGKAQLRATAIRDNLPGRSSRNSYTHILYPFTFGDGMFDIREPSSKLCDTIRDAVQLGYIDPKKDKWLEGVKWQYD